MDKFLWFVMEECEDGRQERRHCCSTYEDALAKLTHCQNLHPDRGVVFWVERSDAAAPKLPTEVRPQRMGVIEQLRKWFRP